MLLGIVVEEAIFSTVDAGRAMGGAEGAVAEGSTSTTDGEVGQGDAKRTRREPDR
jgi:hypothetical protein